MELIDSLRIHKEELDELQKSKEQLTRFIARTSNEKELNEILIKEKVDQIQKNNHLIREVRISSAIIEFTPILRLVEG